jgi:hypothetical protein
MAINDMYSVTCLQKLRKTTKALKGYSIFRPKCITVSSSIQVKCVTDMSRFQCDVIIHEKYFKISHTKFIDLKV